jgi:hypothetical protein
MLNIRNLTPVQVAAINAFAISLLAGIAIYFFEDEFWAALISFSVLFRVECLMSR